MATIHEIRLRLDEFVSNLDIHINEAVSSIEKELLSYNKQNLLRSLGNDDKPLINERTGNANLSKAYARRTGKKTPNIYETGAYQNEMFIEPRYDKKEYIISSFNRLVKYLPDQYKNLHGISPSDQILAKQLTTKAISEQLSKNVFKS
jgi:hypothetical protein